MLAVLQQYRHYRPSLDGYPWLIHPVLANTRHTWLSFHTHSRREWSQNYLKSLVFPLFFHVHHFVFLSWGTHNAMQHKPLLMGSLVHADWSALISPPLSHSCLQENNMAEAWFHFICLQIFPTQIKKYVKKQTQKVHHPKMLQLYTIQSIPLTLEKKILE